MKPTAIGIDLGTTYSCVAVYQNDKVEIIANDQGNRTTPSFVIHKFKNLFLKVSFNDTERLIGDAAKNQVIHKFKNLFLKVALNPINTVYDVKRLIGRKFNDSETQNDIKHMSYNVIDKDNKPMIKIEFKGNKITN